MLKLQAKLRPPHYAADKVGSFVHYDDASLDSERLERELEEIKVDLLAAQPDASPEEIKAAQDNHPLRRWWNGESRYDLEATDYYKGEPVKIRDYFNQCEPAVFTLRRLSVDEMYRTRAIAEWQDRLSLACKLGITACSAVKLKVVGSMLDGPSMRTLYDVSDSLPLELGAAVLAYNRPLSDSEAFR